MARRITTPILSLVLALTVAVSLLVIPTARQVVAATPTTTNARSIADSGQKTDAKVTAPELDRESEAAASNLVKAHLPELKQVLDRLRDDEPRQYERAIRDLARSARKLDTAKKRDERLYEIEVESLQSQTAVNLLTAKLKVRDSRSDRKLLRDALQRLQQASITRGQYDVEMLQQRIERTQQQLADANQRLETQRRGSDEQLNKSFLSLLRKAGRQPESDASQSKKASADSKKK